MNKSHAFMLTVAISLSAITLSAQTVTEGNFPKDIKDYNTTKPSTVNHYQPPYIINDKKLATYFKSETIPSDFPKFDYAVSKKENLLLIKNWYYNGDNKLLLSNAGESKVTELLTKSSTVK